MTLENNIDFPIPLLEENFDNAYLKNYVNVLCDLLEPYPIQVPNIVKPYDENNDLETKFKNIFQQLRRTRQVLNRKHTLIMYFLLGQLIQENNLSSQDFAKYKMTKHNRRIAVRTYRLYENIGVEQIFRSSQINVKIILMLKQDEYQQLTQTTKFAGAQI